MTMAPGQKTLRAKEGVLLDRYGKPIGGAAPRSFAVKLLRLGWPLAFLGLAVIPLLFVAGAGMLALALLLFVNPWQSSGSRRR